MSTVDKYLELQSRMCAKADRDSRAYWIAKALGCSEDTRRHLDERCVRSHRAWRRANDALEAARRSRTPIRAARIRMRMEDDE